MAAVWETSLVDPQDGSSVDVCLLSWPCSTISSSLRWELRRVLPLVCYTVKAHEIIINQLCESFGWDVQESFGRPMVNQLLMKLMTTDWEVFLLITKAIDSPKGSPQAHSFEPQRFHAAPKWVPQAYLCAASSRADPSRKGWGVGNELI